MDIIYPLPEIDIQIINLLHIGELIRLSECNKISNKKIINLPVYISAKQFFNSPTGYTIGYPMFQQYFLAACRVGKFEIIRYLSEKYIFDIKILDLAYYQILKNGNISLIKKFSREFGNQKISKSNIWVLSPKVINYIYGPNYIACSLNNFKIALLEENWELLSYIYIRMEKINMHTIYDLLCNGSTYGRLKWLINNYEIDISINNYLISEPYFWLYYNSKHNKQPINLNPLNQFLILFGKIIFEDRDPNLLSELFPIKNQIDQNIIYTYINRALSYVGNLDLAQYLMLYFITDPRNLNRLSYLCCKMELTDWFLEKLGDNIPILFEDPHIYGLCSNSQLTNKLIATNKMPTTIITEDYFLTAANQDNIQLVKFIIGNSKWDIQVIKGYLINAWAMVIGTETVEYMLEIGVFDFQDIERIFVDNIYQEHIYRSDLLALVLREIKKANYISHFDVNKLFQLTCSYSKNQAKLIYDNYKQYIQLDKNQEIWLGINQN